MLDSAKVDAYYKAREDRLKLQKQVDDLKEIEDSTKQEIIAELLKANSTSLGGQVAKVTLQKKEKPIAGDWVKLYAYIHANNAYDLLQKRLHEGAVKERWEDGVSIPGVEVFPIYDLSLSKV